MKELPTGLANFSLRSFSFGSEGKCCRSSASLSSLILALDITRTSTATSSSMASMQSTDTSSGPLMSMGKTARSWVMRRVTGAASASGSAPSGGPGWAKSAMSAVCTPSCGASSFLTSSAVQQMGRTTSTSPRLVATITTRPSRLGTALMQRDWPPLLDPKRPTYSHSRWPRAKMSMSGSCSCGTAKASHEDVLRLCSVWMHRP
mmetsp:Transcript_104253/g.325135  ORF Transcript_104253/g.325135 Transcript_104253/m.325135 type:complete len:204 (-) Transcript_104253:618-1229(-)